MQRTDNAYARNQISEALFSGKVAGCYIFAGPSGSGRKRAATYLAKSLNCAAEDPKQRPCGKCQQCLKIESANHPDVRLVIPDKPEKEVGIDAIRAVIAEAYLKVYEGRRKVCIIDCDSALSPEASNAFLKTLEEPPADSVFILIARTAASFLPTIVSRSRVIKFFPADGAAERDEKYELARAAVVSALQKNDIYSLDIEKISRQQAREYLDIMAGWYRDVLVAKAGVVDRAAMLNPQQHSAICDQAKRSPFDRLESIIEKIVYTRSCVDRDCNVKLAMASLANHISE